MLSAFLDGRPIFLHHSEWDGAEKTLRQASREGQIVAPCCGAPVVVKWGVRKRRHFAHYPSTNCPYDRWLEPESDEHIAGKILLFEWCRDAFADLVARLEMEHPLAQTLQRPDLYVELKNGQRLAIEYQRTAISLKEWQERHQAYQSLGIRDIWILGENRLHEATPTPNQQERWSKEEPGMHFFNLRAFENAAAMPTPFDIAWWRGDRQEELWTDLELAARTGREHSPWYRRASLSRLRSLTFLDSTAGELLICRAMRELRGRVDTVMASACLRTPLDATGLGLTECGFVTRADQERLETFRDRASRVEQTLPAANTLWGTASEAPRRYTVETPSLDPALPAFFHERAARRERLLQGSAFDPTAFLPGIQEAEQRRRLDARAGLPEWRRIVDRFGLTPDNLFCLVGVPILDDAVIQVHRTVWQAFLFYHLLRIPSGGSFRVRWVRGHLERRFGLDPEMVRIAELIMPARLNGPDQVIGTFLNLLVDLGYLRNDQRSEHFRYHLVTRPEPLAFADRSARWEAWAGLLEGRLRLEGMTLVGGVAPIELTVSRHGGAL